MNPEKKRSLNRNWSLTDRWKRRKGDRTSSNCRSRWRRGLSMCNEYDTYLERSFCIINNFPNLFSRVKLTKLLLNSSTSLHHQTHTITQAHPILHFHYSSHITQFGFACSVLFFHLHSKAQIIIIQWNLTKIGSYMLGNCGLFWFL